MKPYELYNLIKGIKHTEYHTSGDDVQWIILVDSSEKVVRLIFEESAGKRDWQNNLNFPVKIYKKQKSCLKVARGWGDAYKSCNDEIMEELYKAYITKTDYQIDICGWSYGGAMSLLAAEDFYYRTGIKPNVYTFGAPKPLFGSSTKKYVRSCICDIKQYAHVDDCVPLMPPLIGYTRIVTNYIGGKRNLIELFKPDIYHCIYGNKELYE